MNTTTPLRQLMLLLLLFSYTLLSAQAPPVKQWDKTFGGNNDDELFSLQQTSDGGYILGGWSISDSSGDKTENSRGNYDYWIVKVDADGTKQWDKTFGGNSDDELYSLQQTTDGGYILGGYSFSDSSGDKTENSRGVYDYWIVKVGASGTKQWDKTIGGGDFDFFTSLQQTSDGGYILGGYSKSDSSGDKAEHSRGGYDYWIVKMDASGTKQWDKTFGGNDDDELWSLQQTSDGGYILGGWSFSDSSGDKTEHSRGSYDYWIVKVDASGTKQWDKTFGGNDDDELYSLQQTSDKGYILGGWSSSDISGDKTENNRGVYDYWIIKVDASGTKQWDKTFGGSDGDFLFSLRQTSDGGYILGGHSVSDISGDKTENSKGDYDYWIVKVDASGTKQWDKTYGGSGSEFLFSLRQTSDGGYILGGLSSSDSGGDKTENSRGSSDYWIIKLCTQKTFYRDYDRDGYGNINVKVQGCTAPYGYVADSTDCNDNNAAINPATVWVKDKDGDHYYTGNPVTQCTSPGTGYVIKTSQLHPGDCNDYSSSVHPNATEICGNGIDDNCNGQVDEYCSTPTVTIYSASTYEGNYGKKPLYFTLKLNKPATTTCEVEYSTYDISAKAGYDYQKTYGEVHFYKGQVSRTITVYIYGDKKVEGNEQFGVQLKDPEKLRIGGTGKATGTIKNDDYSHYYNDDVTAMQGDNEEEQQAEVAPEELAVPNVLHSSQTWRIPALPASNQVLVYDMRGKLVWGTSNYGNNKAFAEVSAGIYFYNIIVKDKEGKPQVYRGKLLIEE
jgi:hypothetical protein